MLPNEYSNICEYVILMSRPHPTPPHPMPDLEDAASQLNEYIVNQPQTLHGVWTASKSYAGNVGTPANPLKASIKKIEVQDLYQT